MIDFREYGFLPPNGELDAQCFGDRLGDLNVGDRYRLGPDRAGPRADEINVQQSERTRRVTGC